MKLLTSNRKLAKCVDYGYLALGLQLAPGKLSGREVCPSRGKCYATCIYTSGMGYMPVVQRARIARTKLLFKDRKAFIAQLNDELERMKRSALSRGLEPAVRLNTFSDLDWVELLGHDFFEDRHAEVQFYDYTKVRSRMEQWLTSLDSHSGWAPDNYHLTWSHNEREPDFGAEVMLRGGCTAAATTTENHKLDVKRGGHVVDGDLHDLTFLHPKGSLIVLSAKGKARNRPANGFLI